MNRPTNKGAATEIVKIHGPWYPFVIDRIVNIFSVF